MAFRFLNIGDGRGIFDSSLLSCVEDSKYSKTGKAFTVDFSNSTSSSLYGTITLPSPIGADLWIRCDLYVDSDNNYASNFNIGYWASSSAYSNKNFSWLEGLYLSSGILRINMNSNYNSTVAKYTLKKKAINKIWCHLHNETGNNASYGELICNGESFYQAITRSSSNYAIGEDVDALKTIAFRIPKDYPCYLSNVIISDTEISPKEQVIALPPATTITDMTAGASGIYFADAANQTLLQTVDVSTLIENYGASSAVTGIALVGNPAYKTGEALNSLTSLSRSGTSPIEHGTCNLSDDTSAVIVDGWTTENLTIADLQDMQFGWKAGE